MNQRRQFLVCQLDEQGYYVGLAVADESPEEPGVVHLPAGCVNADAPPLVPGRRYKRVEGRWQEEAAQARDLAAEVEARWRGVNLVPADALPKPDKPGLLQRAANGVLTLLGLGGS